MNSREASYCARQLVEIVNHRIHNLWCLPVLISLPNRFHPKGLGTLNVGLWIVANHDSLIWRDAQIVGRPTEDFRIRFGDSFGFRDQYGVEIARDPQTINLRLL